MQRQIDQRDGINSAGFISGYRGSPLGGYDQALWQAQDLLQAAQIDFQPAINEDLAATMILGTQQVEIDPDKTVDGVFALWYGKGPGVDRAGDAIKHGTTYGSSPHGGVLVIAGDDHGCVSSSMPHQSDVAFMAWFMPTINPANLKEMLEFGLWGIALSRYAGVWTGFKAISETVESAASVNLPELPTFNIPTDFTPPAGGLHYRWPDLPGPQLETRIEHKLAAVAAFARANPIDRRIYNLADARFGIVTTGKAYLDVLEALRLLNIDEAKARELGIDIYKVGLVWPLERQGSMAFVHNKQEVLVVEEKRGIIESQIKEHMAEPDHPGRVLITGKQDENGAPLIPYVGELTPLMLAHFIAQRLNRLWGDATNQGLDFKPLLQQLTGQCNLAKDPGGVRRLPYFCSGCPHNSSTKVPEGSKAQAGIGCHFMASWMGRNTESLVQMGGEGVNWAAKSRYLKRQHVFQNLGEGTYFHSGSLAIRQAIAAGANITYKILYNDAVAMTGGQPVDGVISVAAIAQQMRAEGVQRIALVTDNPAAYKDLSTFPQGMSLHHRDEMDPLQREMREIAGVSVLIYEQTCAAELRRRRKRGLIAEPKKRIMINHQVCEGCGDCSVQSNCLSVTPKATDLGKKRQIEQSSCNKDYACVDGFCPSFVSVIGGELRRSQGVSTNAVWKAQVDALPSAKLPELNSVYNLLIVGVGGTGVVTIGAIVSMAAHLENKGTSVLDFMGFAQKGGSVLSYLRLANSPDDIHQVRIEAGQADALIACDLIVASADKALAALRPNHTRAVLNTAPMVTADEVLYRDADPKSKQRQQLLLDTLGADNIHSLDTNQLALNLLGNTVFANMLMLGMAWQQGLVPVALHSLEQAIELNGVAVEKNLTAFKWGRLAAHNIALVNTYFEPIPEAKNGLSERIDQYARLLKDYQNQTYADRYLDQVQTISQAEADVGLGQQPLTQAVARELFRLMAYKDEYEVARLYSNAEFTQQLEQTFSGNYKLQFHLAPPLLARRKDAQGRPKKITFGPWIRPLFKQLAKLKFLRGTPWDLFGYHPDRKLERRLLNDYQQQLCRVATELNSANYPEAITWAKAPEQVRGYGPVKAAAAQKLAQQKCTWLGQQV
jgi:indolepyruvate ferredoxin oxidoreductase